MLSSRTLHMTPGVQESRQDHNKNEPNNKLVDYEYEMLSKQRNGTQNPPNNEHSTHISSLDGFQPVCLWLHERIPTNTFI